MSFRYVSKPVVIEAVPVSALLSTSRTAGIPMWAYTSKGTRWTYHHDGIVVYTLEGAMFGGPTDMLIRGTQGELYPCKLDIFNTKYEAVE
jgi:hypothetical protein